MLRDEPQPERVVRIPASSLAKIAGSSGADAVDGPTGVGETEWARTWAHLGRGSTVGGERRGRPRVRGRRAYGKAAAGRVAANPRHSVGAGITPTGADVSIQRARNGWRERADRPARRHRPPAPPAGTARRLQPHTRPGGRRRVHRVRGRAIGARPGTAGAPAAFRPRALRAGAPRPRAPVRA